MRKQKGRNLKTSKNIEKRDRDREREKKKREASFCFFLVSIQLLVEKLTCLDGENRSPKRWQCFSASFSFSSPSSSSSSSSASLSLSSLTKYIRRGRGREGERGGESREALYNFCSKQKVAYSHKHERRKQNFLSLPFTVLSLVIREAYLIRGLAGPAFMVLKERFGNNVTSNAADILNYYKKLRQ